MKVFFKLRSFPHFSETFVSQNILYAKQKNYDIKIIVDRFLGLENSSLTDALNDQSIHKDIIQPFKYNSNTIRKFFQVLTLLADIRVARYFIKYCNYKRRIKLKFLSALVQFKTYKDGLIHVHFNTALQPIIDLTHLGYISPKCIITFHGYDAFKESKNSFAKKYSFFYSKYVYAVTVNSLYLKNKIVELGVNPSLIHLIPIGFDNSKFQGKPKILKTNQTIILLTVGRLIQLKGQIYGIHAVKKLKDLGVDIRYKIIGEGAELPRLKNMVKELKLEEDVSFYGKCAQDEIINHLKHADIFIMPSTFDNKNYRKEAFGLVSIEAQAMGLPVIGFDSGGFPETLIHKTTGYIVEDRNTDALAEKINFLIDNPSVYENMSKRAIKHSKKFGFDNTYQKYLNLYDKYFNSVS